MVPPPVHHAGTFTRPGLCKITDIVSANAEENLLKCNSTGEAFVVLPTASYMCCRWHAAMAGTEVVPILSLVFVKSSMLGAHCQLELSGSR